MDMLKISRTFENRNSNILEKVKEVNHFYSKRSLDDRIELNKNRSNISEVI